MSCYHSSDIQVWPEDKVEAAVFSADSDSHWVFLKEGHSNLFQLLFKNASRESVARVVDAINAAIKEGKGVARREPAEEREWL